MRILLLNMLLVLPLLLMSQDVELEVSEPIPTNDGQVYGNEEIGFVRVFQNDGYARIQILDKESLSVIAEKEYKNLFQRYGFIKCQVFGEEIYLFSDRIESGKREFIYRQINLSNAEITEPVSLVSHNVNEAFDIDENDYYRINTYQNDEYIYVFCLVKNKSQNNFFYEISVINLKMEVIFSSQIVEKITKYFGDLNYDKFLSFGYVEKESTLYFTTKENQMNWIYGVSIFSVSDNIKTLREYKIEIDNDFDILNASFTNTGNGSFLFNVFAINKNDLTNKFYVFNPLNDFDEISSVDFKTELHPNLVENYFDFDLYIQNKKVETILEENSYLISFNVIIRRTTGGTSEERKLSNIILSKINNEGKIEWLNVIPQIVGRGIFDEKKKICTGYNGNKLNLAYIDYYEPNVGKVVDLDGRYMFALSIDENGKFSQGNFGNVKSLNPKISRVFENCIYKDNSTIASFAYIKKKEDLLIQVKFED